jgi:hypothetical protein
MTNNSLNVAAQYLKSKLAAEGQQPELDPAALQAAAGVPEQAPVDPAAAEAGLPPEAAMGGAGGGEDEIDQLLSQLSPEELEQLAAELAADMQGGGAAEGQPSDDEVAQLAQSIEGNLSQNPEAALPAGAPPEKTAALDFVKSAEYIEGFLGQAVSRGIHIKQAVDMYDQALCQTLNTLSQGVVEKVAYAEDSTEIDEKTAAYYEGVIERAREYGLSDTEALKLVKSAGRSSMSRRKRDLEFRSGQRQAKTPQGQVAQAKKNPLTQSPEAVAARAAAPQSSAEAVPPPLPAPAAPAPAASPVNPEAEMMLGRKPIDEQRSKFLADIEAYMAAHPYVTAGTGLGTGLAAGGLTGALLAAPSDERKV